MRYPLAASAARLGAALCLTMGAATGEQGLMVTQIMDALYRSSEENREVPIN